MKDETFKELKETIYSSNDYIEVFENDRVKNHLHLLCFSGSYSYGTNRPDSDIDMRGIVSLDKLYYTGINKDWETISFNKTDTTVHSWKKMLRLISNGNPDILVMLGQDLKQYLELSYPGKELVTHHGDFLGARNVYNSCVGYAESQMKELELAQLKKIESEKHLNIPSKKIIDMKINRLNSIVSNFYTKYDSITDNSVSIEFSPVSINNDSEIIVESLNINNIMMNDLFNISRDLKSVYNSLGNTGKRNKKKTTFKLNKHCMHTVRGMLMGIECLRTGKIVTYREYDLPLLISILNGDYMNIDGTIRSEFYEMINNLKQTAREAFENSVLPQDVNKNRMADIAVEFMEYEMDLKKEWRNNLK